MAASTEFADRVEDASGAVDLIPNRTGVRAHWPALLPDSIKVMLDRCGMQSRNTLIAWRPCWRSCASSAS